jgi:AraC-like DNA-binding protein
MARGEGWDGCLVLSPGGLVYFGPGGVAAPHAHHAIQVMRSFDEPFRVEVGAVSLATHAACVPSDVRHAVVSPARRHAIVLVEPHGPRGAALQRRARELVGHDITALLQDIPVPDLAAESIAAFGDAVVGGLVSGVTRSSPLSPEVRAALDYLERHIDGHPRLSEAASAAYLSSSRLTHRFSREVGIPFRRYVLWLRLLRVGQEVSGGASLGDAAVAAGFSDTAHLSRVFRRAFGVVPSAMLQMQIAGSSWPAHA